MDSVREGPSTNQQAEWKRASRRILTTAKWGLSGRAKLVWKADSLHGKWVVKYSLFDKIFAFKSWDLSSKHRPHEKKVRYGGACLSSYHQGVGHRWLESLYHFPLHNVHDDTFSVYFSGRWFWLKLRNPSPPSAIGSSFQPLFGGAHDNPEWLKLPCS